MSARILLVGAIAAAVGFVADAVCDSKPLHRDSQPGYRTFRPALEQQFYGIAREQLMLYAPLASEAHRAIE